MIEIFIIVSEAQHSYREIEIEREGETDRQKDRQTDTQTERQTDRKTDRHTTREGRKGKKMKNRQIESNMVGVGGGAKGRQGGIAERRRKGRNKEADRKIESTTRT